MRRRAAPTLSLILAPALAVAAPEDLGAARVETWDAGTVTLAGTPIHVVAYFPAGMPARPVVGVVHGASRTGAYHRVLAQTLASHGLVAVVPDIPCNVWGCDHDANANQINALLDWAVAQSAMPSSRLAGAVDGARRGLIGHSWGALGSTLAASRNAGLASLVLFDPNDDALVGARNAARVRAPTLTLLAQTRAVCNNQWVATTITPGLAGPGVHATLPRSGHCDPEDPTDPLCPLLCGRGDAATTPLFRRYAVAWTRCNLTGDVGMAPWVLGAGWDTDQRAGLLAGVARVGDVAGLACLRGADAGAPTDPPADNDAAVATDVTELPAQDAVAGDDVERAVVETDVVVLQDAAVEHDASAPLRDVGARGDVGPTSRGAGCGCSVERRGPRGVMALLALTAAIVGRRRRRAVVAAKR
ncbi:MAG: hypothetical protein U0325_06460 [Polyangiales bacterium]